MFIKAVVELPSVSGFAEDTVTNTFIFNARDTFDPETELLTFTEPIAQFYTAAYAGGVAIGALLSDTVSRAALSTKIKLYDITGHLDGSPHGSPIAEDATTLPAPNDNNSLPSEVALVMTLRGSEWEQQPVEGDIEAMPVPHRAQYYGAPAEFQGRARPRSRYTGRIFLGPLTIATMANEPTSFRRPAAATVGAILTQAEGMADEMLADGHNWVVWSRRNAQVRNVVSVEMDDAFDVQRRRGAAPTVRTTRVFA